MAISRELATVSWGGRIAFQIIGFNKKVNDKYYCVYILTSKNHKALYVGVTSNLARRVYEHKTQEVKGHTSRYKIDILVHYEAYNDVETAIMREKQIKTWNRKRKTDLITQYNPAWEELKI